MSGPIEAGRLRRAYAQRGRYGAASERDSPLQVAQLFALQQRQRAVVGALRRHGFVPLAGRRILEVGCGGGGVMLELIGYGADPGELHGADLLEERVRVARERVAGASVLCADGRGLPYRDGSFDLVLQFTAFSSILDDGMKRAVASEMRRVLRPDGLILWYDFWLNPTNPDTRGICPKEIRTLFPQCTYDFQRISLAPPLARRLVPISWIAALALEKLSLLNTHYMAAIRPLQR